MTHTFAASRLTSGNTVFPDKMEIDDEKVTFYKSHLVGYETTVILRANIGSVTVNAGMLFADIVIETNGGQITTANGFKRSEAKEIQSLLTKK